MCVCVWGGGGGVGGCVCKRTCTFMCTHVIEGYSQNSYFHKNNAMKISSYTMLRLFQQHGNVSTASACGDVEAT